MDRMIYVAMTGARNIAERQATLAHNLANATTTGYRADTNAFRAVYVNGPGLNTRAFAIESTTGADFTPGAFQQTGRDLDVAVQGRGWLAVQLEDGSEAYTRAGSLQVNANGLLQTRSGQSVVGDTGPISVPQDTTVAIGRDGTITATPFGTKPNTASTVGRLKLVDPPEQDLVKGNDGLFRLKSGGQAEAEAKVTVTSGGLESSNVNPVEAMVGMIEAARQYEMQIKLLQSADQNARDASQVLAIR